MACQVVRIGQQLIDLAVAKDPVGRNGGAFGCGAFEGSLVERTNSPDSLTLTTGAQCKLRCQLLGIRESGAGTLVARTGMVAMSVLVVSTGNCSRGDLRPARS